MAMMRRWVVVSALLISVFIAAPALAAKPTPVDFEHDIDSHHLTLTIYYTGFDFCTRFPWREQQVVTGYRYKIEVRDEALLYNLERLKRLDEVDIVPTDDRKLNLRVYAEFRSVGMVMSIGLDGSTNRALVNGVEVICNAKPFYEALLPFLPYEVAGDFLGFIKQCSPVEPPTQ